MRKFKQVTLNANVTDPNVIFVFGSNDAGIHGAGAASHAVDYFDAEMKVGKGLTGRSYALPTKDYKVRTLPLFVVQDEVREFIEFARNNKNLTFLVTAVGCGLAGFSPSQIAPMFKDAPENVFVSPKFIDLGSDDSSTIKGSLANLRFQSFS